MDESRADLLQGTLDMLILQIVALQPIHGYGVSQRIQQITRDILQVQQGSLYPALHRLEEKALLAAEWRQTEGGRMAKYYTLTRAGRKRLSAEKTNWDRMSAAIGLVLSARAGEV